jgi:hypothetical protein
VFDGEAKTKTDYSQVQFLYIDITWYIFGFRVKCNYYWRNKLLLDIKPQKLRIFKGVQPRQIGNLHNRSPIKPEAMDTMMKQLKKRIERLLKNYEITDPKEREVLHYLLRTKKWNYCIRHSAIIYDPDFLPEFALK